MFLLEFALDVVPDGVAGVFGGFEEAFGVFSDGFEIANEGGAVGVFGEEGLEARVGADVSVAVGEEVGQEAFEVRGTHGVEVWKVGSVRHAVTSLMLAGWADES